MKAILYFIDGEYATAKEQTAATKLSLETGKEVLLRNINAIVDTDPIEKCLGAAGLIPEGYTEYKKPAKKKEVKKETKE